MLQTIKDKLSAKINENSVEGSASEYMLHVIDSYEIGYMNKMEVYGRMANIIKIHSGANKTELHHRNLVKTCRDILNAI